MWEWVSNPCLSDSPVHSLRGLNCLREDQDFEKWNCEFEWLVRPSFSVLQIDTSMQLECNFIDWEVFFCPRSLDFVYF